MNKLTTTLAGLALVAAASVAPAFAQGNFFTNGPFTFTFSPANSFTVTNIPVTYNSLTATGLSSGFFSLTGGTEMGTTPVYTNALMSFSPTLGGTPTVTSAVPFTTVVGLGSGTFSIASVGSTAAGDTFNLTGGTPAAVPEASTVLSFGALLALGGFAVLRKKTAVSTAA